MGVNKMSQTVEMDPLTRNLNGDRQGLPDWYTHFGDKKFAQSAVPTIEDGLNRHYTKGSILVVGLGAGTAYYERIVGRVLNESGWNPRLFVSDLQEGILGDIPQERFPVYKALSDSTKLPLPDGLDRDHEPTAVLSRAIEHYLSAQGKRDLIREAARVLKPGELYFAQLSSGSPATLHAFPLILEGVAGKKERFLSKDDYTKVVAEVTNPKGSALFEIVDISHAQPQSRNTVELGRRYLNDKFISLVADRLNGQVPSFKSEVTQLLDLRENLRCRFLRGEIEREEALRILDQGITATRVFDFYKAEVASIARQATRDENLPETEGLSFDQDGNVTVTLTYPIFTLRRTEHLLG